MLRHMLLSVFIAANLAGCGDRTSPSSNSSELQHHSVSSVGKKVIYVNVHTQTIDAYHDGKLIRSFPVSTGKASTPTDLGVHRIGRKLVKDSYPTVDNGAVYEYYSMYFNRGESFHHAWWHNDFGKKPRSNGCVNMKKDDVIWLYNWAPIGTTVVVQDHPSATGASPAPAPTPRPTPTPAPDSDRFGEPLGRGQCRVDVSWGETVVFYAPNWSAKSPYTLSNGVTVQADGQSGGFVRVVGFDRYLPGSGMYEAWLSRNALKCR